MDGDREREDRAWAKLATLIAYLGWHKDPVSPKHIYDQIRGVPDESGFEKLAGMVDPAVEWDAMVAKQAARKEA